MGFLIGVLTVVMVLDCLVLMFLVLIQLPKKEAGAGLAFGGSASDALFGAGSGTVLTKITKYAAGTFFVLAVVLSLLQRTFHERTSSAFQAGIMKASPGPSLPAAPPATPQAPASQPVAVPVTSNVAVKPAPAETTNLTITIPSIPPPPASTNK